MSIKSVKENCLYVVGFTVSPQNQTKICGDGDLFFLSCQISQDSSASESTEEDSDQVGSDKVPPFASHTEPQNRLLFTVWTV